MENTYRLRQLFISTGSHSCPSHHLLDYANDNFPAIFSGVHTRVIPNQENNIIMEEHVFWMHVFPEY